MFSSFTYYSKKKKYRWNIFTLKRWIGVIHYTKCLGISFGGSDTLFTVLQIWPDCKTARSRSKLIINHSFWFKMKHRSHRPPFCDQFRTQAAQKANLKGANTDAVNYKETRPFHDSIILHINSTVGHPVIYVRINSSWIEGIIFLFEKGFGKTSMPVFVFSATWSLLTTGNYRLL